MTKAVADPIDQSQRLSGGILAALQLATELREYEVAERLLQALELLSGGDLEHDDLRAAYSMAVGLVPPDVH
jgi:hypothetical protein